MRGFQEMSIHSLCQKAFMPGCNRPWVLRPFLAGSLVNGTPTYVDPTEYEKADATCFSCDWLTPRIGQYIFSDKGRPDIQESGVWISSKEELRSYLQDFASKHGISIFRVSVESMHAVVEKRSNF